MSLVKAGRVTGSLVFGSTTYAGLIRSWPSVRGVLELGGEATGGLLRPVSTLSGSLVFGGYASYYKLGWPSGALVLGGRVIGGLALDTEDDVRDHIDRDTKGQLAGTRMDPGTPLTMEKLTTASGLLNFQVQNTPVVGAPPADQATDASGNARHATYSATGVNRNTTSLLDNDNNGSATFDGSAGHLDLLSAMSGFSGSFTVECILERQSRSGGYAFLMDVGPGTSGNRFALFFDDTYAYFVPGPEGASFENRVAFGVGVAFPLSTPFARHHLAYTVNIATQTIRLYVDGSFFGQIVGVPFSVPWTDNALVMANAAGTRNLPGVLDEFAIYVGILPDADIADHASRVTGTGYSGAVLTGNASYPPYAYYRLSEGYTAFGQVGDMGYDEDAVYVQIDATTAKLLPFVPLGTTYVSDALTAGHLLVGNASNIATDVALSGDATISNTGAVTLANDATTRSHLGLGTADSPTWAAATLTNTSNQIILGTTRTLTLTAPTPATSSRVLTFPDPGGNDSVVYLALAQTLTNKTLTSPTLGGTVAGTPTWASLQTFPGVTATAVVTVPDGSAAAPGLRVTSEATGIYRASATSLGFSIAGTGHATLSTTMLSVVSKLNVGSGTPGTFDYLLVEKSDAGAVQVSVKDTHSSGYGGFVAQNDAVGQNLTVAAFGSAAAGSLFGVNLSAGGVGTMGFFSNNSPIVIGTSDAFDVTLGSNGARRVTITSGGNVELADAANVVVGTTNGTKFGTATSQRIGFHNATPVAQETVTGSRGGNAALADLLTKLANKGLIADGTSA